MPQDPSDLSMEQKIRANAQLVVEGLGEAARLKDDFEGFGLNRESVEWVDGYIQRQRQRGGSKAEIDSLVQVIGSFLGEAIIKTYGGKWSEYEGNLGILFGDAEFAEKRMKEQEPEDVIMTDVELRSQEWDVQIVFPFAKVHKQFQQGRESGESIY